MKKVKGIMKRLWVEEDGQSLSEYALILAIVVIAVIAILIALKDQIVALFQKIIDALKIA
jgi:Flp pilus assembly pilin Flp